LGAAADRRVGGGARTDSACGDLVLFALMPRRGVWRLACAEVEAAVLIVRGRSPYDWARI